jgi:hypothetical protein
VNLTNWQLGAVAYSCLHLRQLHDQRRCCRLQVAGGSLVAMGLRLLWLLEPAACVAARGATMRQCLSVLCTPFCGLGWLNTAPRAGFGSQWHTRVGTSLPPPQQRRADKLSHLAAPGWQHWRLASPSQPRVPPCPALQHRAAVMEAWGMQSQTVGLRRLC